MMSSLFVTYIMSFGKKDVDRLRTFVLFVVTGI
jgi:hypothetical protein